MRNRKTESLLPEAREIAEEIAADPNSPRIRGPENCEKNFTDLEKEYGKGGPAALFAALAHTICEHCPSSLRDEAGVPDVLKLTDSTQSIHRAHLTYLVPDSPLARIHQGLGGGSAVDSLDSSLRLTVRKAKSALDFQLVVTAAHAGDTDMEEKAVAEYAQHLSGIARYDRIHTAILAAAMTRHGH